MTITGNEGLFGYILYFLHIYVKHIFMPISTNEESIFQDSLLKTRIHMSDTKIIQQFTIHQTDTVRHPTEVLSGWWIFIDRQPIKPRNLIITRLRHD